MRNFFFLLYLPPAREYLYVCSFMIDKTPNRWKLSFTFTFCEIYVTRHNTHTHISYYYHHSIIFMLFELVVCMYAYIYTYSLYKIEEEKKWIELSICVIPKPFVKQYKYIIWKNIWIIIVSFIKKKEDGEYRHSFLIISDSW